MPLMIPLMRRLFNTHYEQDPPAIQRCSNDNPSHETTSTSTQNPQEPGTYCLTDMCGITKPSSRTAEYQYSLSFFSITFRNLSNQSGKLRYWLTLSNRYTRSGYLIKLSILTKSPALVFLPLTNTPHSFTQHTTLVTFQRTTKHHHNAVRHRRPCCLRPRVPRCYLESTHLRTSWTRNH